MFDMWIYVALGAYLINAAVFVIDKYLLAAPIPKPFVYAFWSGLLSSVILALPLFFEITLHDFFYYSIAFTSGAFFFGALIFLYGAIRKSDVSIASTQVGVMGAIFTFIFSLVILGETFSSGNITAFVLLVAGIYFLGAAGGKAIFKYALAAGVLFGLSFVLLKWTFNASDLLDGIFWTRIGFIGSAVLSLISSRARKEVKSSFQKAPNFSKAVYVGNKTLAGIGFLILYYAIQMGSVTIVNAMLGFQFLFVFLIAYLLRNKIPGVREHIEKAILTRKLIGFMLVIAGFFFINFAIT